MSRNKPTRNVFRPEMRRFVKSRALKFRQLSGGAVQIKNLNKFYDKSHKVYLRQMLSMLTRTSLKISNYSFSMHSHLVLEQRLD